MYINIARCGSLVLLGTTIRCLLIDPRMALIIIKLVKAYLCRILTRYYGKEPLIISNDIISFETTSSKANHVSGCSLTFISSQTNYIQELTNGDWMLLWAFENYADFLRVLSKVQNILFHSSAVISNQSDQNSPDKVPTANGFNDGLKFVGRISSVGRNVSKEPEDGKRHVFYNVTGNGFTDLDFNIFYNEFLAHTYTDLDHTLLSMLGVTLNQFQADNQYVNGTEAVPLVIDNIIGLGPRDVDVQSYSVSGQQYNATVNDIFRIPKTLVNLLIGSSFNPQNSAGYSYADLLVTEIGIQDWNVPSSPNLQPNDISPESAFNSAFHLKKANRYRSKSPGFKIFN